MKKKHLTSKIDGIIIDLILEHYNIQEMSGKRAMLSGNQFMDLVNLAEEIYFKRLMEKEGVTIKDLMGKGKDDDDIAQA